MTVPDLMSHRHDRPSKRSTLLLLASAFILLKFCGHKNDDQKKDTAPTINEALKGWNAKEDFTGNAFKIEDLK